MKLYILHILLILLFFTGCRSDFDWRTSRLSSFGQDFVRQYGWPNEKQDWKTAVRYRVDVNVDGGGVWNIKVFSADPEKDPRKAYLLGSYSVNASDGDCHVFVDAPYTLRSLFVGIEDGNVFSMKRALIADDGRVDVSFANEDLMAGQLPSAVKMSYFIAYEVVDSASTYLDYNDIILEIIHVSGEETADVKLRAVGAKENMKVSYRIEDNNTVLYENVHSEFGYYKPNWLINVEGGNHDYRTPVLYSNLHVGSDFSVVENADRFVVTVLGKKKDLDFSVWPNSPEYVGMPPYAILVACPEWDWGSEGGKIDDKMQAFPSWVQSYRLYNIWWDSLWDPHELVLFEDGSYQPDYNYTDMIYGIASIKQNNGVPDIKSTSFENYTSSKIGANLGFVIMNRNGGDVKISLERSDGGVFEWYPTEEDGVSRAFVEVSGIDKNVDAGVGCDAESCHILISTKTMQQIINSKATIKVIIDPGETGASINSVWIRER